MMNLKEIYLQIEEMEIVWCNWNSNESHGGMFNIENVFIEWANKIIGDSNATFITQEREWIIVPWNIPNN